MRPRFFWRGAGIGLGVLLVVGGAVWGVERWELRVVLDRARGELRRGNYAEAQPRLAWLASRWSNRGEVPYLLGLCALAEGRPEAAMRAWGRVPRGSVFAEESALRSRRLAMDRGRFVEAEAALTVALARPGPNAAAVRQAMLTLLWREGRLDEAARLTEAACREAIGHNRIEAVEFLRGHLSLDLAPFPVEPMAAALDVAARLAPGDDRVWLARANLATRTGRFDDARADLEACLRRRPDDPAVWSARLDWAMATGRVEAAWEALDHLAADAVSCGRMETIRSWLTSRRGDRDQAGERDAWQRYRQLFKEGNLAGNASEMARLAEVLGRRFEARAFHALTLDREAAPRDFRNALVSLDAVIDGRHSPGHTLADVLACDLNPKVPGPRGYGEIALTGAN